MPTTQTVHIQTYDYGASLSSATLRVVSTDVLVATADTVNEVTADSGLYAAVFGETAAIAAGEYRLRAIVSGKPINRYVTLAGTDGEIVEARNERLAVLDSAAIAAVADAVLRESILDHRNVADSLAKFIWQIRQANLTIDGTVSNAITPTTLTFASNVVATTSAYAHAVLLFTTGTLAGENSPIISYNSSNGVFLLEEPLTAAPSNGDEFVVIAGSHVHSVADIQSGLATAAALATESTKITAIETFATRVTTGLVADGAVYQFTANMLELAPSSGGGAGDASQATLLEVKAKTDLIGTTSGISSLLAASVLTPGTITEFPDTLTIGDSYTTANGRSIQIPIVDTDGNQISSTGSLNFADATATFVIKRAKETDSTRIITGTAAFTDPVGTGTSGAPYAVVQLTSSETAKGLIGYKYSGVLTFTWPYVGTGTDPEVMSFETDTLNFDN